MGKARSMARKKTHDDVCNTNTIKTYANPGVEAWSDLNHDVLKLVMIRLGVIDFLAFSGVCKSWRSLALSNWNSFMVSQPPMSVYISSDSSEKKSCLDNFGGIKCKIFVPHLAGVCKLCRSLALSNKNTYILLRETMCVDIPTTDANERVCYLKDFEGRKFKTILPHSAGSTYIGLSCGYLILFRVKTSEFWLVNPITRQELHFPDFRGKTFGGPESVGAILLYSPKIRRRVFAVFGKSYTSYDKINIWFCIAGKQKWTCVSAPFYICAIHDLKGKIYTLHHDLLQDTIHLYEMRLYPKPEFEFLGTPDLAFECTEYVRSGGNLYALDLASYLENIKQLNFSKVEWESCEKIGETGIDRFLYFFLDCLNVSLPCK